MTTETRLTVEIQPGSLGPLYLDLAAIYSAANHRFISQSHVFTANFIAESAPSALGGNDVGYQLDVLPTTWPIMGAYKHGRKMYEEAMKPESTGVKKSRWNDFRVTYESAHNNQSSVVLPVGVSYNAGEGEYKYSAVYDDSGGIRYRFHILGGNDFGGADQSFGMLQQYDDRDDTDIENSGGTNDYNRILNDYNTANEQELIVNGDLPPYNSTNLQVPEKRFIIHATGSSGATSLGYSHKSTGFIDVPLGLVKITNLVEGTRRLTIVFKSGKNKGVSAVKI